MRFWTTLLPLLFQISPSWCRLEARRPASLWRVTLFLYFLQRKPLFYICFLEIKPLITRKHTPHEEFFVYREVSRLEYIWRKPIVFFSLLATSPSMARYWSTHSASEQIGECFISVLSSVMILYWVLLESTSLNVDLISFLLLLFKSIAVKYIYVYWQWRSSWKKIVGSADGLRPKIYRVGWDHSSNDLLNISNWG